MSKLTDECLYEMWDDKYRSWIGGEQFESIARAIEAAATGPLLQRIEELEQRNSDLHEDVQRFKQHALNEKAARLELERQLEETRAVLKATGLLLHHFWCDVQMNEYSFEKLNKGMEAIDAAMQKGQS